MILRLINSENDTITEYNSARTTLAQDPAYAEFIEVIDDIEAEELKHVGQLQTLLKRLSPNASNIEAGEEEAEGQLTEDLDNMERVTKGKKIDVHGEVPVVMADAVMASEEADDAVEDEIEEHNKKTQVKLNKVLGAEKQPVPKMPEVAKVTLDESLFEDYRDVREYSDMLFDMIEEGTVDAEEIAKDLIYWCSEDDIKRFMELRDLIWDEDDDIDESLKEAYYKDVDEETEMEWQAADLDYDYDRIGVYVFSTARQADIALKAAKAHGWRDAWRETNIVYMAGNKIDESLNEGRKSQLFVDKQGIEYSDDIRWDEDDEDDDLFELVYNELSMDIAHDAGKRVISNKEYPNSKRFRFDDEVAFDDNDGVKPMFDAKGKLIKRHIDRRNAKIDDNKFILSCEDEEQLKFAKRVADEFGVDFNTNGLKAVITIPEY